jgi:putative ABC transport system permease protein
LGATPGSVRRRILRDAAGIAAGGVVAGALVAGAATRLLQSVLYGVSHLDPVAYTGGAVLLVLAALLGAYVPARRSSLVDPAVTMRGEE